MPKFRKHKKTSETPKLLLDPQCPRCTHKKCGKCSEIPELKCGSIAFERGGWVLDIPRAEALKGMLCCRCGRAAYEVQWFEHSWIIDHSPKVYYADSSTNNPPTVSADVNILQALKRTRKS
jgi:hypothetical protein